LCNGARMPIMSFDGLGCRAYAAEITPMEPVWFLGGFASISFLNKLAVSRVANRVEFATRVFVVRSNQLQ